MGFSPHRPSLQLFSSDGLHTASHAPDCELAWRRHWIHQGDGGRVLQHRGAIRCSGTQKYGDAVGASATMVPDSYPSPSFRVSWQGIFGRAHNGEIFSMNRSLGVVGASLTTARVLIAARSQSLHAVSSSCARLISELVVLDFMYTLCSVGAWPTHVWLRAGPTGPLQIDSSLLHHCTRNDGLGRCSDALARQAVQSSRGVD